MATAGLLEEVIENPLCINASGIDGAPQMIANARGRGGDEEYILGNIDEYESPPRDTTLFTLWRCFIILKTQPLY